MPTLRFTKGNMPTPEEFRCLLREAQENADPVEDYTEIVMQLGRYEQQYQMPSAEFYEKYERGEMGDAMDFMRWSTHYRMFLETQMSRHTRR
jgi:hypothetical protein